MAAPVSIWSDFVETANKRDVYRQLTEMGYQVSERTFYRHCAQGKCRKNEDGVYSRRLVKSYADLEGLARVGVDQDEDDGGKVAVKQAEKIDKENEKLEWSNRLLKLKYERSVGRLIEREGLYLELAARMVALDTGFRQRLSMEAPKLIASIGGDLNRQLEFEDLALELVWNELLNDYCSIDEFEVLFDDLAAGTADGTEIDDLLADGGEV